MMDASSGGPLVLAADIGGTAMRVAVVDREGKVSARRSQPTLAARGFDDAASRLVTMLEAAGGRACAVGISTAGPLDPASGTYRMPPNLPGWDGHSMKPLLESRLGLPVVVGHDATVAAMAERRFGAARGTDDLVYVTVSTGIGAGIIANGRPVTGAHGGAGEVGHLIVRPGGPACGAGCRGCLEGTSSGTAIAASAHRRLAAGEASLLRSLSSDERDRLTAAQVINAAADGDRLAGEVVADAVRYLAAGLASLLNALDPEVMVLGGGVIEGLRPRWGDLLTAIKAHALPRYAARVPVVRTTLGSDGGLLGAALLAFESTEPDR